MSGLKSFERAPKRTGDARFYEPPVRCAKRGCNERLTIAAVVGGSKHCSREHAGFPPRPIPTCSQDWQREVTPASPGERGRV